MALLSLIFLFPFFVHAQLSEESGTIDVDLIVEGCNNNLICESIIGEDTVTCPLDCPEQPAVATPTPSTTTGTQPYTSNRRATTTTETQGQSGSEQLQIENLIVSAEVVSATFSFSTPTYTIASVRVGQTSEYEERAVAEFGYRKGHSITVTGLQPNATYLYELFVADIFGNLQKIYGTFTTKDALTIPSIAQPLLMRPSDIKVLLQEGTAAATWVNPIQSGFSYTTVVRTTEQPAQEPGDGILVYEGVAPTFFDQGIVPNGRYFYTFFATYRDGLTADGVFVEVVYNDEFGDVQTLEQFSPRFGDETFSMFDFSFTQQGTPLVWESKILMAEPAVPVVVRFKKPDFFGPLEDVYLEAVAYNQEGAVTERRFQKLSFRTELYSYQTILDGFAPDQTVLLTLKIFREDGTFAYVLGKMHVGALSFYETSSGVGGVSCRGFAIGFEHFKNVLWCSKPWPFILLVALVAVCMHWVRKKLR